MWDALSDACLERCHPERQRRISPTRITSAAFARFLASARNDIAALEKCARDRQNSFTSAQSAARLIARWKDDASAKPT